MYQQENVCQHVEQMLQHRVVCPSTYPRAVPVVLVRKKDGKTRFCMDYRWLNDLVTVFYDKEIPQKWSLIIAQAFDQGLCHCCECSGGIPSYCPQNQEILTVKHQLTCLHFPLAPG